MKNVCFLLFFYYFLLLPKIVKYPENAMIAQKIKLQKGPLQIKEFI